MTGKADGDVGIPDAALLMAFADAIVGSDDAALAAQRDAVRRTLGSAALVDAAAVAAAFNGIDRVADATGTPAEEERLAITGDLRAIMGIDDFARLKLD